MRKAAHLALAAVLIAAGCVSTISPAPSLPTGFTQSPSSAPPSQDAQSPAADDFDVLIASMQDAVRTADRDAYLDLVDLSDPVFALEHARWAADWAGPDTVSHYSLQLVDLVESPRLAIGRLIVTWALDGEDARRTATFPVRFTRDDDRWRYAGEAWVATEAAPFRVLAQPGLERLVPDIVADLPGIYDHVTTALDYEPVASMEIKVYADAEALVANTLLSLPSIHGWNEPGEALKLRFDPDIPSFAPTIAHEFSHFVGFDRAGTRRTQMPWWLDEGVATYVQAPYEPPQRAADRLARVVEWQAKGELADWDEMAVFEEAPLELWQFAYPQGYAMVRYVTERHGDEARNEWLRSMATELTIDAATPAALDVSFNELDARFRQWLAAR